MKTTNSSECEKCAYAKIDESDKSRIKIVCERKDKTYYFGQRIECEDFDKKSE